VFTRAIWSILGGNSGKVNKKCQNSTTAAGSGATSEPEEVMMIEETWMQPYLAYMINKQLPEDAVEAKRITR
jgi:hypothetical protein